jgi:hypothetical protein
MVPLSSFAVNDYSAGQKIPFDKTLRFVTVLTNPANGPCSKPVSVHIFTSYAVDIHPLFLS